ncbi:MAG: hypothetical protein R2824_20800 [Saprospiraceae bacterium]|nr:hypothetical protein [Lewinella sp.]
MKQSIFMTLLLVFAFSFANAQNTSRKGDDRAPKQEYEQVRSDLDLSKKQEKQLKALYDKQQKEFDKRKTAKGNDRPAPPTARTGNDKAAFTRDKQPQAKHDEFEAEVKKVLNDEQFKKWKKMKGEREKMEDARPKQ